jgi:TPP-dependent pyruvate/acetoin dehydrogenase alpha subunit
MEEKESMSDKAIQRLRKYLLDKGWMAEQILDLINYITK